MHRGTQCSMALSKSCSQRRSTNSRTDRFFSGNSRQSKSREPGGTTTPLPVPSDDCGGPAVGSEPCSDLAAFSSLAKTILKKKQKIKHPVGIASSPQIQHMTFGTNCALHSIELKYLFVSKTCFFNFLFLKGLKLRFQNLRDFIFFVIKRD